MGVDLVLEVCDISLLLCQIFFQTHILYHHFLSHTILYKTFKFRCCEDHDLIHMHHP